MEYKGKLYAKVGDGYFTLKETTDDIDKLKLRVIELEKLLVVNKISFSSMLDDVPCPICNGDGYTAEHGCNGNEDECAGMCPIQVQCHFCKATGRVKMPEW
jgi:hypothetical protein